MCFCSLWSLSAVHRQTVWCQNWGDLNSSSRFSQKETFKMSTLKLWMWQKWKPWVLYSGLQHVCALIFMTLCALSTSGDADFHLLNLSSLNLSHRKCLQSSCGCEKPKTKKTEKEHQHRGGFTEKANLVSGKPVLPEINKEKKNYLLWLDNIIAG